LKASPSLYYNPFISEVGRVYPHNFSYTTIEKISIEKASGLYNTTTTFCLKYLITSGCDFFFHYFYISLNHPNILYHPWLSLSLYLFLKVQHIQIAPNAHGISPILFVTYENCIFQWLPSLFIQKATNGWLELWGTMARALKSNLMVVEHVLEEKNLSIHNFPIVVCVQ